MSLKIRICEHSLCGIVLLLTSCGTMNPFDTQIVESMSTQLSDIFVKEEVIVYEKEELDALKAADPIPLKWKDRVSENQIASFYTVYDNGALYVADEEGKLTKYDAATGKQLWQ